MNRFLLALAVLVAACAPDRVLSPGVVFSHNAGSTIAISDLGPGFYLGQFQGGLYEGGSNVVPLDHSIALGAAASQIVPRDASGNPSPSGKKVLAVFGMSNVTTEVCRATSGANTNCTSNSLLARAAVDPAVDHATLVIVNCAQIGKNAADWASAASGAYSSCDSYLGSRGVTPAQVGAVLSKNALKGCDFTLSLPNATNVNLLRGHLAGMARAVRTRYPNAKQLILSNRIYGGWAPVAGCISEVTTYETGFAVRGTIQCQIDQSRGQPIDPVCGDLSAAPIIAWLTDSWADGLNARSDGLLFLKSDMGKDGVHPNPGAVTKVANLWLGALKTVPFTSCWFLAGQVC